MAGAWHVAVSRAQRRIKLRRRVAQRDVAGLLDVLGIVVHSHVVLLGRDQVVLQA